MQIDVRLAALLEELAANAWPAHIQQTIGTWRLRANFGVTWRANSVYTSGAFPDENNWIHIIEEFYQRHAISACFYVSEVSPPQLDAILEARGYKKDMECSIMTAVCGDILERVDTNDTFTYGFASEADDDWIRDFIQLEEFSTATHSAYAYIFSGIEPSKSFVRIYENGKCIGLGTVVVERGWGGLSNIIISAGHRGKGAGAQLLRALTERAVEMGAEHMYLQIMNSNTTAWNLYKKLGFICVSQHHYRIVPSAEEI